MYEDNIVAVLQFFHFSSFRFNCTDLEVVFLCLELLGAVGHVLEDGRQRRVDPRPLTEYKSPPCHCLFI